jgi:hypothetical protein
VSRISRALDRIAVNFDDPNLLANAGLLLVATLADRLDLEALVNATVPWRAGWAGRAGAQGADAGRRVVGVARSARLAQVPVVAPGSV